MLTKEGTHWRFYWKNLIHGAKSIFLRNWQVSSSQEIFYNLWNSKVHYRIHVSLSPFPAWARSIQSMPYTQIENKF